jgi:hypothetical protein
MPPPSTRRERLVPCFLRSTGEGPAASPPQGAFNDAPVDEEVLQVQADHLLIPVQAELFELAEHFGVDPFIAPPTNRGGRAASSGDLDVRGT